MQTNPPLRATPLPQPVSAPLAVKPPLNTKIILISLISFFLLTIIGITAGYFFYVRPRQITLKVVNTLLPRVEAVKVSTKSVRASLDTIYLMITEDSPENSGQPLETSGVIIHPQISRLLIEPNILGLQTKPVYSFVEKNTLNIYTQVKNAFQVFYNNDKNIAGIQTVAENINVQTNRKIKDETIKARDNITKAKQDLDKLMTLSDTSVQSLPRAVKTKISDSQKVNHELNPYINEAKKISDYYNTLSDILININLKVTSFKNSLTSASSLLASVDNQNTDPSQLNTRVTQSQIFLDQAKKDTDEIKKMSESLKGITEENLPLTIQEYHAHNIAVLESVTQYFTSSSSVLQGFITAYQSILQKAGNSTLQPIDILILKNVVTIGVQTIQTADAKFVSALQKLIGEEKTLTISFWQNNTIIASGDKVEKQIDDYDTVLNKLKSDNKIPYLKN